MDIERNKVTLVPAGSGRRLSISSSSKFEIRRSSDSHADGKAPLRAPDDRSPKSKLFYRTADLAVTMIIVFPLSIGFWRGVWNLMEYYSDVVWGVGPWISIGVGYAIPFTLYIFQEPLKRHVIPGPMNFIPFYIVSRFILLLHAFGSVNQWRGLWSLLDIETGLGPKSSLVCLVVGIFFNVILRTFSNVLAPPLLCCVDEASSIHDCTLRFKTPPEKRWLYFWDCCFSVFVIPSLTVLCWRGVWNLADFYLYPADMIMSSISSLGFGYILCIILCSAQPLICEFVCGLKGLMRLTVVDMTYMVGFIGCVFAWRGVWNMLNILIIFDTDIPKLSEWVTTLVGMVGTVLLGCVSTVMVRGIAIDGEMDEDEAAEWLIPYISHLRQRNYEIPFPEPWMCRYLCTSQKMNCDKLNIGPTKHRVRPKKLSIAEYLDGVSQPLKKKSNVSNSHPGKGIPIVLPQEEEDNDVDPTRRKNKTNPTPRIKLSQVSHIDRNSSSSEEEGEDGDPTLASASPHDEPKLQEVITVQRQSKQN